MARFLAKIRPQTCDSYEKVGVSPAGWLLSAHLATPGLLSLAARVRAAGEPLMADNGSKEKIDQVADTWREEARALSQALSERRPPTAQASGGASVPTEIRARARALAASVLADCDARSSAIDGEALLLAQLEMAPTELVAEEDFAVACLLLLGLDRSLLGWPVEAVARRTAMSLERWERVARDPRVAGSKVYAVLSAMDYATARASGARAARRNARRVAVGFAAVNLDTRVTDRVRVGRVQVRIDPPAPRRYPRVAEIVSGIAQGFRDVGVPLEGFHALGIGSPDLFVVTAGALDPMTELSFDSTTPIYEAVWQQVIFDPREQGRRLGLADAANALLRGDPWPCTCVFCTSHRGDPPEDLEGGRAWWRAQGSPVVGEDALRAGGPLARAVPVLALPDPAAGPGARETHVAHNHQVLGELAAAIPSGTARPAWAREQMRTLIASRSPAVRRGLRAAAHVLWGVEVLGDEVEDDPMLPQVHSETTPGDW